MRLEARHHPASKKKLRQLAVRKARCDMTKAGPPISGYPVDIAILLLWFRRAWSADLSSPLVLSFATMQL